MFDGNLSSTEAYLAHGFLINVWTDDKILLCCYVDAQIAYQREVKRERISYNSNFDRSIDRSEVKLFTPGVMPRLWLSAHTDEVNK